MTTEEPNEFGFVSEDFLSTGDLIAGRYKIAYPLGAGGFAQVYLATHLEVDSLRVAIKVLHPSHATPETLRRFRNEAQLLARLRNRQTVRLTDFGITDDNTAYLVMEYVEGTPLDRVIYAKGPLGEADTARLGIGVLKSLVEAHSVGIIHRDLKPANIMLVSEVGERHPVPRVLDFGIAKVLGGGSPVEDHIVNAEGVYEPVVYCTPAYAAPELLRGRPEFATDLYGLGLVLVEMLDGRPPYDYPDDEPSASPHLWDSPVPLGKRASRSRLAPALRIALQKELPARYVSAEEMLNDLEKAYEEIRNSDADDGSTLDIPVVVDANSPPTPHPSRLSRFVDTSVHGVAASAAERDRLLARGRDESAVPPRPRSASAVLWVAKSEAPTRDIGGPDERDPPSDAATRVREVVGPRSADDELDPNASIPPLASSGASSRFDPREADTPAAPLNPPRFDMTPPPVADLSLHPAVSSSASSGSAPRAGSPVRPEPTEDDPFAELDETPQIPAPRRNDSRLAEIPFFGKRIVSTRISVPGVLIVLLAILVPALIAAWSVFAYLNSEDRAPQFVPDEPGDVSSRER